MPTEWPCELSEQTQDQLQSIAQFSTSLSEIGIYPDHSVMQGTVFVRRGQFSLVMPSGDDRTTTGYLIGAGEWVGGLSAINGQSYSIGASALTDLELIFFPRIKLNQLCEKNPEIYKWVAAIQAYLQLKILQTAVCYLHSLEARVVYFLFEYITTSPRIYGALPQLKFNQTQVSEVIGMTRPRVNQVFQKLAKAGEIELSRGSVTVLDIHALSKRLDVVNLQFRDPRLLIPYKLTGYNLL